MERKKWTAKTSIDPTLIKFREKRKWQMALRRYVLDKQPSVFYAPYFGLDIENFRKWIEIQFLPTVGWNDFAKKWQFDHIVPVAYFNFLIESDLKMCWNFTNIKVGFIEDDSNGVNLMDFSGAKKYFKQIFEQTNFQMAEQILEKIKGIESAEIPGTGVQIDFIKEKKEYLQIIENFSAFEFERINRGRDLEEVRKEMDFIKKFNQ
jgi:hypothetical protein